MSEIRIDIFTEVLFDWFKKLYKINPGGAGLNYAWYLNKLFVLADIESDIRVHSRVGKDPFGQEMLNEIKKTKISNKYIQIDTLRPTGIVPISINGKGDAHFEIVPSAFDYMEKIFEDNNGEKKIFYFGSILQRNKETKNILRNELEKSKNEGATIFYDVNLRDDGVNENYNLEILNYSFSKADIVKLNIEELLKITVIFSLEKKHRRIYAEIQKAISKDGQFNDEILKNIGVLTKELQQKFNIPMINVTFAEKGSMILDNKNLYFQKIDYEKLKKIDIKSTVGAGDAFGAALTFGYLNNWDRAKILEFSTQISLLVVQIEGAFPTKENNIKNFEEKIKLNLLECSSK